MKDFMIKLVATDMDGTFLDGKGRFDMERLKNVLVSYEEKGIYFAVASGRGILSLKKLFADVRDEVIFIAENGSYVEFHGENMYEATMSRDFYLSTFEVLKKSPYFDERKMRWILNVFLRLKNVWKNDRTLKNETMVQASSLGLNKHKRGRLRYRGDSYR